MFMRVCPSSAAKVDGRIFSESVVSRIQRGMLAGENERRLDPTRSERVSDWS
jgi:hypothetical protein